MKKIYVLLMALLSFSYLGAQKVGIKTNLLYDLTTTINLGFETALSKKMTLDISANLNPWEFGDKRLRHFLIQPELRYWTCSRFNGSFFGLHGHAAWYNVGGLPLNDNMRDNRYQGFLYGAGISYGYQWMIGKRWNLEATIGAGFAILEHEKIPVGDCQAASPKYKKTYWGITKIGVSLIYLIN